MPAFPRQIVNAHHRQRCLGIRAPPVADRGPLATAGEVLDGRASAHRLGSERLAPARNQLQPRRRQVALDVAVGAGAIGPSDSRLPEAGQKATEGTVWLGVLERAHLCAQLADPGELDLGRNAPAVRVTERERPREPLPLPASDRRAGAGHGMQLASVARKDDTGSRSVRAVHKSGATIRRRLHARARQVLRARRRSVRGRSQRRGGVGGLVPAPAACPAGGGDWKLRYTAACRAYTCLLAQSDARRPTAATNHHATTSAPAWSASTPAFVHLFDFTRLVVWART